MDRIRRLRPFPKTILIITGIIAVIFTAVYALEMFRSGFWYGDVFLKRRQEGESTVYAGALGGERILVTVSDKNTAEFKFGDDTYGPFSLERDPSAVPEDHVMRPFMTGITIRRGTQVWFRGAIMDLLDQRWLYDSEKDSLEPLSLPDRSDLAGSAQRASDLTEPSAASVTVILDGPPLGQRGGAIFWFPGIIFAVLTAVSVIFAEELFRWSLQFRIRDAEQAEPSEWFLLRQGVGWVFLALLSLLWFALGLILPL